MTKHDSGGILSSFYSIISGGNEGSGKLSESENAAKLSRECVAELQPELIVTESKFLRLDSLHELVKEQFCYQAFRIGGINKTHESKILVELPLAVRSTKGKY